MAADVTRLRSAFLTCEPNELVAPLDPEAMLLILSRSDYAAWLEGTFGDIYGLIRP